MSDFLEQLAKRQRFGMRPGLDTIHAVLDALGNPERNVAAIHIAGTNGKGSVAAMCESVLRHAGYPVGRYTSPHLVCLNERFFIHGKPIEDVALETATQEVEAVIRKIEAKEGLEVTFFECLTAIAFVAFRNAGLRLVVLETGLGGRLDATNVILPIVSVITRIGCDHCEWLGSTIEQIAREKAGIVKSGRPVVCAAMPEEARTVIAQSAREHGASFIDASEEVSVVAKKKALNGQLLGITTAGRSLPQIHLPLAGLFQMENVAAAVAALEVVSDSGVGLSDEAFKIGLESVCWPGRFQQISAHPRIMVDGAHNPDGATALRQALKSCGVKEKIGLIAGFCDDKDVDAFLAILSPIVRHAWSLAIPNPRSVSAEQTATAMRVAGMPEVTVCDSLVQAVDQARAWAEERDAVVVICGSLFLAGAALTVGEAFPWRCVRRDANESMKGAVT